MHIEGPWLSTTSTKKRSEKLTKAKQEELERNWRERNVRLKEMQLPKETFEQFLDWVYGRGKKEKRQTISGNKVSTTVSRLSTERESPKSLNSWITGPVTTKPSPEYTGQNIIGIATMHKSNLVPVFSGEEAKDISKMRRG